METCIFCQIIKGEIPSQKVYETKNVLAIRDINPQAPIHILLMVKKHTESLNTLTEDDKDIASELTLAIPRIAEQEDFKKEGYRVIINNGKNAGQLVPHLHYHILAGKHLGPKIIAE